MDPATIQVALIAAAQLAAGAVAYGRLVGKVEAIEKDVTEVKLDLKALTHRRPPRRRAANGKA